MCNVKILNLLFLDNPSIVGPSIQIICSRRQGKCFPAKRSHHFIFQSQTFCTPADPQVTDRQKDQQNLDKTFSPSSPLHLQSGKIKQ